MSRKPAGRPALVSWSQLIGLLLAALGFFLPWLVHFEGLSPAGHLMFGIFIMAVVLWISEAIPMHATAALIILMIVLLLSDQHVVPLPDGFKPVRYGGVFATLADPIIILFLGGFFLADGAAKFGLDKALARLILRPFGARPAMVLLGLMLATGIFSMFMSNTATTATMMAVALPVILQLPAGDRMRAAIALSIPAAANIGGIGTPIGTPPNAIALGQLRDAALARPELGIVVPSFAGWMLAAVPFMLLFLFLAWLVLVLLFRSKQKEVILSSEARFNTTLPAIGFYFIAVLTIGLWLTEPLHGINSNVVGFVPVVAMLSLRIFAVKDLQSLDWHVLWLVAGGIALGLGVRETGLATWFIQLFDWGRMGPLMLVAILTLASLIMGTFMSHSATANLLVPIGITMATAAGGIDASPVAAAVFIAIGSSLAMALPISTPPNAIAFSTGEVRVKDMAILGAIIGVAGWGIFVAAGPWFFTLVGILPK